MVAAGFKVVDAKTQLQQERLAVLPQDRVSEWQRTGKTFFVYPDLAKKQLYLGSQKEYEHLSPALAGERRHLNRPAARGGYGGLQQAGRADGNSAPATT